MDAMHKAIGFLSAYQESWHRHFPGLFRHAQWRIVTYLCVRQVDGVQAGELSGLIKHLYLLDEATVRDRLIEIRDAGLCAIDPDERRISARSIIRATPDLLTCFDRHFDDALGLLLSSVGGAASAFNVNAAIADQARLLDAIDACNTKWIAALDRLLASRGLTSARRLEAKRHLLSLSYWMIMHLATAHYFRVAKDSDDADGLQADDMAAVLLRLTRQNFQTTRNHINYLIGLDLLERRPGRVVRVTLPEPVALALGEAFAEMAADLQKAARSFLCAEDDIDTTLSITGRPKPEIEEQPAEPEHLLVITREGKTVYSIVLGQEAIVIGRSTRCAAVLEDPAISRTHCSVTVAGRDLKVTDLNSKNGILLGGKRVGSAFLADGATVSVGPYVMTHECYGVHQGSFRAPVSGVIPLNLRQRSASK